MNNDKYYQTNNFYLAAFLFAKGLELVNLDKTDPRKSYFVFANHPELEILLRVFNYGNDDAPEAKVDARKFTYAIKKLKDSLYEQNY